MPAATTRSCWHPPRCGQACAAWPAANNQHCGHDQVTRGDAEYNDTAQRQVYAVCGGIHREYGTITSAFGTYKLRVREGDTILEHQYTHIQQNPAISINDRGEYVAPGIWIGNYVRTDPQTGPVVHVHVVIKYFYESDGAETGVFSEDITEPNGDNPKNDNRYGDPGLPAPFFVPFFNRPAPPAGRVGVEIVPLAYTALVRYENGEAVTYTYTIEDLPPGLTTETENGSLIISGTPSTAGIYEMVITATDDRSSPRTGSIRFTWTINP